MKLVCVYVSQSLSIKNEYQNCIDESIKLEFSRFFHQYLETILIPSWLTMANVYLNMATRIFYTWIIEAYISQQILTCLALLKLNIIILWHSMLYVNCLYINKCICYNFKHWSRHNRNMNFQKNMFNTYRKLEYTTINCNIQCNTIYSINIILCK